MSAQILDPTSRFRPTSNVHTRCLGDELVVLDFARGEYFALNEVGTQLWDAIEKGATLVDMAARIAARYDVSEADALHDAAAFVEQLVARALVERA